LLRKYKRHRYPPEIISYAVCLNFSFNLSHRPSVGPFVEGLLAQRDIIISRESIRLWCNKFGPKFARRLRKKHKGFGDTFYLDAVFVKINGIQYYLWRAVDQDGDVVDVLLQRRRDGAAAKRFFARLLKSSGGIPRKVVTDKLRSYNVAHRELMSDVLHDTSQYANNRAELLPPWMEVRGVNLEW
jgi:putative transposase